MDTETGDAKVMDDRVWGGYLPPTFAAHDGAVSFLDSSSTTAPAALPRHRAGAQGRRRARRADAPGTTSFLLLFHDGRIHIVREELGSRTVWRGSEWWVADPDGRRDSDDRLGPAAGEVHRRECAITASSPGRHHIQPRQEIRVNAVEFVNLPPADPAREPPVGLTPEDPERVSAKLTPVKLDAGPGHGTAAEADPD